MSWIVCSNCIYFDEARSYCSKLNVHIKYPSEYGCEYFKSVYDGADAE